MENYLWLRLKGIDDGKKATCERRQNIKEGRTCWVCVGRGTSGVQHNQ